MDSIQKICTLFLVALLSFFGLYALYEIVCFLWIDFPFNYYESEVITDAIAFHRGNPLFPARSEGPWGGLYAPFYHFVLSFLFFFFPETITTGRLVSILSMLVSAWFIYKSIKNLPFKAVWAFVAIFVWHQSLLMFDMHAKPDSLGTMLGMAALFVLVTNEWTWKMLLLSALFSVLSVSTKQSMLFIPAGIGLALLIHLKWRELIQFSTFFVGGTVVLWTIFHFTTGPDMWYYVFVQPGTFKMRWGGLLFNIWDINNILPWLLTIPFIPKIFAERRENPSSILFLMVVLLAIPACVLSATKGGGQSNSFQPFFYIATWFFLFLLSEQWNKDYEFYASFKSSTSAWILSIFVLILFTWQPNVPSIITSLKFRKSAHQNYSTLIKDIRANEEPAYCAIDNYLHIKAGNPLRWSVKWESETLRNNLDNKPKTHSNVIALQHSQVVTIHFLSWVKELVLEEKLQRNGYTLVKTYPMDQLREYRLWRLSSENADTTKTGT